MHVNQVGFCCGEGRLSAALPHTAPSWRAAAGCFCVLYLLVGLFQNGGIVFERLNAVSRVHVVEMVRRVQPRRLDVVDGEFYIWRHPRWLDGAEVNAFDGGAGVGFAHWRAFL